MNEQADRTPGRRNKRTLPEPRSWIVNDPHHTKFGNDYAAVFNRAGLSDNDIALSVAAKTQHHFAGEVRQRIKKSEGRLTTATVAANAGMTIDQLRRILRGEVHLTYSDANLIALHTGGYVPAIRHTFPETKK